MEYMNKSIEEIHQALLNQEVTMEELIEESLKKSQEVQKKYNAFVTIIDNAKPTKITDNLLSGIPYGIKTSESKSMSNISKERLLGLEINLPPIELQNQFAAFVEQTDKSKVIIQQNLDTLEILKESLMQEYFG